MYRILFGLFVPIIYAFDKGCTYQLAFIIIGLGVFLAILSSIAEGVYYNIEPVDDENEGKSTSIQVLVATVGLFGIGLIPSGGLILLLLFFEVIPNIA